jgi:hypothetical protein
MLFDLRSPGRRRMIKVIYTFLAILMAVGLVGFGIGGATSGGIFDVSGGCGGDDANNTFQEDVDKAQERTQKFPSNAGAWAALTRAQYQLAATQADQQTGAFTDEGRKDLLATDRAYKRYLALAGEKPDPNLASLMVQAYTGLNRPKDAQKAQQIVVNAKPNANAFYQLAVYAYAAGDTRTGDLASQKAIELTPKDLQPALRERIKEAKQAAQQPPPGSAGAGGAGGATPTPAPSG